MHFLVTVVTSLVIALATFCVRGHRIEAAFQGGRRIDGTVLQSQFLALQERLDLGCRQFIGGLENGSLAAGAGLVRVGGDRNGRQVGTEDVCNQGHFLV